MYLLDTNTVIYFFKGMGDVAKRLLRAPPREVGVPTVVVYELAFGVQRSSASSKRVRQLEDFLREVRILPFGADEAWHASALRFELETKGCPIGPYDVLIAATALAHNHILVTHNLKEFSRVPGLRVEDWF